MDPRTRTMLDKLCSNGTLRVIHGCISTGKEANVYYAESSEGERAVKIYKTSILVFKDRDKYVTGEYRFRHGYCKSNPRKMVKVWAEKEMRNLKRLYSAGIPCPLPVGLKNHVLIMSLIGESGQAAPRLKNAELNPSQMRDAYGQLVLMMRKMFHTCRLIHADLSEYNLLWLHDTLYVIDVSQSVEHDHPHSMEFLKKDVENMTRYFSKEGGVGTMTVQDLFEFIMREDLADEDVDSYLAAMQKKIDARAKRQGGHELTADEEIAAAVFMGAPVLRRLDELVDYEKEFAKVSVSATTAAPGNADLPIENFTKQAITSMAVHTNIAAEKKEKKTPSAAAPAATPAAADSAAASKPAVHFSSSASSSSVASSATASSSTTGAGVGPRKIHAAKPSAKAVSAPTTLATARDQAASALFAGLLLPQVADQDLAAMTNEVVPVNGLSGLAPEPGYISGEDEEEEDDHDLPAANANHTLAGARRVMNHVQKDDDEEESESEYDSDEDDDDDEQESDEDEDHSESDGEDDLAPGQRGPNWVDRSTLTPEEAKALKKAAKKEIKVSAVQRRASGRSRA